MYVAILNALLPCELFLLDANDWHHTELDRISLKAFYGPFWHARYQSPKWGFNFEQIAETYIRKAKLHQLHYHIDIAQILLSHVRRKHRKCVYDLHKFPIASIYKKKQLTFGCRTEVRSAISRITRIVSAGEPTGLIIFLIATISSVRASSADLHFF